MCLSSLPPRRWLISALGIVGICALAACSTSADTSGLTGGSTTQSAAEILSHARNAGLQDATFTISLSGSSDIASGTSTTGPATPFAGTGKGQMTTSPKQVQLAFDSIQVSGVTTQADVISTNDAVYLKLPILSKWIQVKQTQAAGLGDVNDVLNYTSLQNVTLVGTETINGVPTYHLRSSGQPDTGATTGESGKVIRSTDLWLRQDNYFPMKLVTHAQAVGSGSASQANVTPEPPSAAGTPVAGSSTIDQTIIFTAWNTGVTITPPPASDIQTAP